MLFVADLFAISLYLNSQSNNFGPFRAPVISARNESTDDSSHTEGGCLAGSADIHPNHGSEPEGCLGFLRPMCDDQLGLLET